MARPSTPKFSPFWHCRHDAEPIHQMGDFHQDVPASGHSCQTFTTALKRGEHTHQSVAHCRYAAFPDIGQRLLSGSVGGVFCAGPAVVKGLRIPQWVCYFRSQGKRQ